MSLAHGRQYLAIPGPSVMPDRVLAAMHRAAPNIYEGALIDMVATLWPDLKAVACTQQHVALYIGNGHAAWEAANANVFSRGDKALVLITGRFGEGWAASAEAMGVQSTRLDFGRSAAFDLARVAEVLAADKAHTLKAVLATHVDTSSTARNNIAGLRQLLDDLNHPALLMVDAIASLACDAFRMDDWGVDVLVGASQKGLMVPPGLGFLWFSEKAREASRAFYQSPPHRNRGTPAVLGGVLHQERGPPAP
ncbi:MAG: alanine--glyoxylate aminotransferase family protein, partial [Pararhodobacter sp.]|nr:alanine--glyoxylate aminotransferase family protein [Pararhodobacter sp.]